MKRYKIMLTVKQLDMATTAISEWGEHGTTAIGRVIYRKCNAINASIQRQIDKQDAETRKLPPCKVCESWKK